MNVWVLSGSYEGEQFASSHLTEKGACLAAIADVLELLGVEDEETAKDVYSERTHGGIQEDTDVEPPEWDFEKLKAMRRDELWGVFGEWNEKTWDSHMSYSIEVIKTTLQA